MATSNNRDARLGIEIQTTGEDGIKSLAAEVRTLGKTGGPAAGEFNRLADQLDRLSDQAGAVKSVQALGSEFDRLTLAQSKAAATAEVATARFNEQVAATTALRAAQSLAAAEATQAKAAYDGLNAELARQVVAGKAAGESQKELATRTQEARLQLIDQGLALKTRNDALLQANAAVRAASAVETKLRSDYEATTKAAAGTATALQAQSAALTAAKASAADLGLNVTALSAAEEKLRDDLTRTVAAANAYATANRELAAATALAERGEQTLFNIRKAAASLDSASRAKDEAVANRELAAATALAERGTLALFNIRKAIAAQDNAAATRAEASALADSAAAMALLEGAARKADAQMEALAASLRETENVARRYTAATEQAAAAGAGDAAVVRTRVAAAEALIASERSLTAGQSELAATRDRVRTALLNEAQALLAQTRATEASAAATQRLVRDATALGTALDGTGRSIGRIGTLTEEAFGKTGVRSLQAIEAEVAQVDRAMSLLERRFRSGQIGADDLARATGSAQVRLAGLKREAETFPALPGQFERMSASIQGLISKFGALGAAVATVGVAVRPVIEATIALDQMRRTLTTVTGSAAEAEKQIDFLRRTSQQSGQSFTEVGQSYAKFAASALQSGLSVQQVQDVFKSVALAAGNLGLSSDQAKRALEALSQIASKGVVSMEELRQQLGDALPGVLPLLAKELGLTQQQLNKVVESGQLLASEAIPAIGRSLRALQPAEGVVSGIVATFNRFVNVVKEAGTVVVEGPLGQVAGVVLNALGGVIRDLSVVVVGASEAFKVFGLSTLSVLDALAGNLTFSELKDRISDFAVQSGDRLAKFKETAYGTGETAKGLTKDLAGLGDSFAKLAFDQQKAIDAAALSAQSSEKNVQAKKSEGEATAALASLLGDETEKRLAGVQAALAIAAATEQLARADEAVVVSLKAAREATEAKAVAEGIGRDAIKATIEALDVKILKSTADAEKTQAQADATRLHAEALALDSEKAKDNSGRLVELGQAVAAAAANLKEKTRLLREDAATTEDVKKATEALAKAKGLLRDAINDVSEALERQLAAMRAEFGLAKAQLQLDIEIAKNAEREALAQGNADAARQAAIKVRGLEQQVIRAGITLKAQEAEASLRAINIEERELALLGQLTPEKAAALDVKRKLAQASLLEAEATQESNKSKANELEQIRAGLPVREALTSSVARSTAATEADTSAVRKNTSAVVDQITRIQELTRTIQAGVTGGGALGTLGGGNAARNARIGAEAQAERDAAARTGGFGSYGSTGQVNLGKDETFDKAQFDRDVASYFANSSVGGSTFSAPDPNNPRYRKPGGSIRTFPGDGSANGGAGYSPLGSYGRDAPATPQPGATPSAAPVLGTYSINFNIGGKSHSVTAGSQSQAEALIRQLEEAFRAAGGKTGP